MNAAQKEELERIYLRDVALDPKVVLGEAKKKASPLHECFEWDDGKAAHEHRLHQARQLIRVAVTIIPAINSGAVRQYVSISTLRRTDTGSYLATVDVMNDAERYKQMLADALTTLRGLERRYAHIRELSPIWSALADMTADDKEAAA